MDRLPLPKGTIAYWCKDLVDEVSLIYPEGYEPEYAPFRGLQQIVINYQTLVNTIVSYRTLTEVNPDVD